MFMEPVSWIGVFAAIIAMTVLGSLWYSIFFGKLWMRLSGHTEKSMKQAKERGMSRTYFINFIGTLLLVYVLAQLMQYLVITTWADAAMLSVGIWVGFFATTHLNSVLWDGKPWTLYFINAGYSLVALILSSIILVFL